MKKKLSFPKNKIKIALFEKVSPAAKLTFESAGFNVEEIPRALEGEDLERILPDVHVLGIRSRSKLKNEHFEIAKKLLVVGSFAVGTDQVDLNAAMNHAVPVFNAPHSSTRSVAELTIGCIVALARRLCEKSSSIHNGTWDKNAQGCVEVRNKTVGIIGYGHIGQQVGLLAESLGMNVLFFDIIKKLPLGRAKAASSLTELIQNSNFISLHVPGGKGTDKLISQKEFSLMKKGSYFLNLSRGTTVDLGALKENMLSGHLAGAAVDVFPVEPAANNAEFQTELAGISNIILTPHIGASTEEAQYNIGREVATSIINYIDQGNTQGAVNFPNISLSTSEESHRILYIHQNLPGALSEINQIISDLGVNIIGQHLSTHKDIGYLIMDINKDLSEEVKEQITKLPKAIKTRLLF